ncbi:unnamed protein product [Diplocarpon coronariae]
MPIYFERRHDRSYNFEIYTWGHIHGQFWGQEHFRTGQLDLVIHSKGAVLVAASAELLRSAENSKQFLCVEPLQNSCRDISPDVLPSAGAPNSSTMVGIICAALGVVSCDLWGPTVIYVNSSSYMACTFEATNAFRLMGGGWAEIPSHQNGNLSA